MRQKNGSALIGIILIIIVVGITAGGVVWYWKSRPVAPINTDTTSVTPNEAQKGENLNFEKGYEVGEVNRVDVQWNGEPVLLPDLKLVVKYQDDDYDENGMNMIDPSQPIQVQYYDLGTNKGNKIILAVAPAIDPSGPAIFFFEQTATGYRLMANVSNISIYDAGSNQGYGYVLSPDLEKADTTTRYNGVVGPAEFDYHGLKLRQDYLNPSDLFENYVDSQKDIESVTVKKIDTVDFGDLYVHQVLSSSANNDLVKFYIRHYVVKLPSGLYTTYAVKYDFVADNLVPRITWNNGIQNVDAYSDMNLTGGCGGAMGLYTVAGRDVSNAIQVTGMTSTNEKIYEFKDVNDPVMKFFYDLVGGKVYDPTTGVYNDIALDQWAVKHPVILYRNTLGDYVVFRNDKYGPMAECGKPVIYLYPTKLMNVKVQVGASITKSEPVYNNGWQVQASPDGTLKTTHGAVYNSLFWEGLGNGLYPAVREGVVVQRDQVESTLKAQLQALGLSARESKDFLEFWLAKMPQTPYTRLTWFTTKQMDELAPLVVWPKPDTTIRVFLDFQGLQKPISLPLQHLESVSRQGFTLVEWGGLLEK